MLACLYQLTLNKAAYVGMCVLDLSENLMVVFHYNYIKKKYGQDARGIFKNVKYMINEE